MAMLRHRRLTMPDLPMRLIYSVRTPEDVIYADELGDDAVLTFTRSAPDGWCGHTGRVDQELVSAQASPFVVGTAFLCGTNGFVEATSQLLLDAGLPSQQIRTERFGPTG
jgi:ferredoxin-NADP reductase